MGVSLALGIVRAFFVIIERRGEKGEKEFYVVPFFTMNRRVIVRRGSRERRVYSFDRVEIFKEEEASRFYWAYR